MILGLGVSVRWLGHASFEVKAGDKVIYVDPYEGDYRDRADVVLVSHSHYDHCDASKIKRVLKDDTLIVAPADCGPKIGEKVKSLRPGEGVSAGEITVEAVEAYNYRRFRSPGVPFHPKGLGVGYVVTVGDRKIYHAGDTDFIPEMRELRGIYLALLPSGGTYTMDSPEAAEAAVAIRPEFVIPMHRWSTDPNEFKRQVEAKSKIRVVMLKPGERFEFS